MPLNARNLTTHTLARRALPLAAALLAALSLAALAPAALAQSVNNSASRPGVAVYGTPRIINVGILRLGGPTGQNADTIYPLPVPVPPATQVPVTDQVRGAYLFYILNNRPDILPSIWTLKNPNAPTRVDATISARFPTANTGYVQDAPVTQNMAPYWEINGDTVDTVLGLSAYDLIVITTSGTIALNSEQRRALRQFVDKGGTLWIDTAPGATLDPSLIFHAELGTTFPAGGTSANDLSHPLVTGYYTLASSDLDNLGLTKVGGSRQILSNVSGNVGGTPDPSLFHAVNTFSAAGGSNFGSIAAADYGNGHILITDRAICDDVNDNVGLTGGAYVDTYNNEGGIGGTNFLAAPAADLKFIVNVLAWASNADGPGGGGRFDNAQPGAVSGAIQSNWTYTLSNGAAATQPTPAGTATYGNRMFMTTTDGYLLAFDINPGESLAYQPLGGGAADSAAAGDDYIDSMALAPFTGIPFSQDYSKGYPYDEIWGLHVADAISAPTVAEIPVVPTGGTVAVNTPEVLVETDTGVVSAYNAVTGALNFTVGGAVAYPGASPVIPAPTYYRGRIYATQYGGTVKVTVPGQAATNDFSIAVESTTGVQLSSLAVQSIPQSAMSGNDGEDVMGYIYDLPGGATNDIYALYLGARDEHLQYLSYTGATNASTYETGEQAIPALTGLLAYGAPEDTDDQTGGLAWLFDFPNAGNNIAVLQQIASPPAPPVPINQVNNAAPPTDMYADYDLRTPGMATAPMTRTTIVSDLMGAIAGQHGAIQGIAVSSVSQGIAASLSNESTAFNTANNVYVTVNENNNTTGYIMSVKERTPNNAKSFIAWRFALVSNATDAEGVTYSFGGYHFVGAPVSDGNGYVYALATNGTSTRLMAFFANAVCGFVAPFTATSVTQTDELGNNEAINPVQYQNNTFTNFSASGMTVLQPDLCVPLPLTVSGSSQNGAAVPDVSVPVGTAQGAEPLLAWWIELPASVPGVIAVNTPGVTPTSPLRKIGNTLYFGGQETTVSGTPAVTNMDYALFAVNADPFGIGLQADPTTRQITSTDYRLIQVTPSGVGPISLPPSGTGKYLVTAAAPYTPVGAGAQTPGGIEGFGYVPTLVTDNHRLVEMDPSGNATWVVDSTREPTTQIAGGAVAQVSLKTTVPLNRPTSLTQFSTDDYLLADTGNNRVIHIGRIGDVLTEFPDKYGHTLLATTRLQPANPPTQPTAIPPIPHALEITGFSDPGGILAPGAPTTLNQPSNVTFWMTYDSDPSVTPLVTAPTVIVAHYLICDTGNNRIVEVDDTYTLNQSTGLYDFAQDQDYHQLVWVTKTTENGHRYKYVAAQGLFPQATANYDPLVSGPQAILAAVSNARVASLALPAGGPPQLSPSNQDSQGSAVLALTYNPLSGAAPTPYATYPTDGLPFVAINTVQADGATAAGVTPAQTYPLRGLRSIQAYGYVAPTGNTVTGTKFGLVVADDDGVFDGVLDTTSPTIPGNVLDATTINGGWSFRAVDPNAAGGDYASIVTQYDTILDTKNDQPLTGAVSATDYQNTPFSPASALRLANNSYLIVNRGGSGNPNGVPAFPATGETGTDFGGNVFVVRANTAASGKRTDGGTLSGVIFGKPANTGALDGPSFALKSN